ncbi:EF-hand [Aaosphaeria arxii CBS 175.79]|uniref:EF-hand n=1 Tax=Aaosphaeria arxii CBS 175.79 TaxID=1450172 RepID=A0A6A5YBB5_9PLEO|nr:EF-hand [Aaosphaeria arxii CBS 175.79]KAF2021991.1 EF-hand [Aaosphaeria arxii CBS 175.79]
MSTTPTPYKPSPLSFNSPRTSPFRRPNSPLTHSPSTTVKPSTPTSSPLKPTGTPSQTTPLRQSTTSNASANPPPPWLNTRGTTTSAEAPSSPTRHVSTSTQNTVRPLSTASIAARFDGAPSTAPAVERPTQRPAPIQRTASTDSLSKIPPALLHSMRESFSVLDRDNSGSVDAADIADMLSQLGLSATPSSLAAYFPDGAKSINLATYLNTLSDLLSGLSHPNELNAAFEAFDDGDDGQIDLGELKDALLHTAPEAGDRKLTEREIDMVVDGFSGRRAFGKGSKGLGRGEVFRYQEFVASVTGSGNGENGTGAPAQA